MRQLSQDEALERAIAREAADRPPTVCIACGRWHPLIGMDGRVCRRCIEKALAVPESAPFKRCSRCQEQKPRGRFSSDRRTRDRLHSQCKECRAAAAREARRCGGLRQMAPQAPAEVTVRHKWCPRCELFKRSQDFYRRQASADGLQSYCKECSRDAGRAYRRAQGSQPSRRD